MIHEQRRKRDGKRIREMRLDEEIEEMFAAAFAKGMLDLEGQLTPILVSLVSKDSSMLDGLDTASIEMEAAKVCPMT
uniref:Uncharacterized protein n=1 Tax=Brassica campestris TaxID=3711 RepID=M4ER65_BRACM